MTDNKPRPTAINLHQQSRILELNFDDGEHFRLSTEYLRVYSPSAEVRGHGPGQEVLQVGKENVNISNIEQVGNYAVKLTFDDGHDSGIYSWEELHRLGKNEQTLFAEYLEQLKAAGHQRAVSDTVKDVSNGSSVESSGAKVIKI